MQWVGWAALVATEVAIVSVALSLVTDWPHHDAEVALAASGLVPLALAIGTVPRMLARVDRLLTHTVSLAGLTALIVVAYLLALAAFGRKPTGSERSLLLLSMLAAAGAALAYQPARAWLTERANRVVYGDRVSPDEALRTWGMRLTRAIPLDELLLQLAETLRKSMQLRSAQIWTGSAGHYEIAAMVPHRALAPYFVGEKERVVVSRAGVSGGTWLDIWLPGFVASGMTATDASRANRPQRRAAGPHRLRTPRRWRGLHRGRRPVADRPGPPSWSCAPQRAARHRAAGVARRAAQHQRRTARIAACASSPPATPNGASSSATCTTARSSTWWRWPSSLRLAKDAVVDDPVDAEAMIDEVRSDLQNAITELRALAHGIFPPLLISGGLAEALPAAAARAALPTTTEIAVERHNQEVEAAIYFCCMEALQNAGKHAGAEATAVVKVWEDGDAIHWQVADDGAGFDPAGSADAGHGFLNMRDRMGSFGGTLEVISGAEAGTTIRGHIPIASSR